MSPNSMLQHDRRIAPPSLGIRRIRVQHRTAHKTVPEPRKALHRTCQYLPSLGDDCHVELRCLRHVARPSFRRRDRDEVYLARTFFRQAGYPSCQVSKELIAVASRRQSKGKSHEGMGAFDETIWNRVDTCRRCCAERPHSWGFVAPCAENTRTEKCVAAPCACSLSWVTCCAEACPRCTAEG